MLIKMNHTHKNRYSVFFSFPESRFQKRVWQESSKEKVRGEEESLRDGMGAMDSEAAAWTEGQTIKKDSQGGGRGCARSAWERDREKAKYDNVRMFLNAISETCAW